MSDVDEAVYDSIAIPTTLPLPCAFIPTPSSVVDTVILSPCAMSPPSRFTLIGALPLRATLVASIPLYFSPITS